MIYRGVSYSIINNTFTITYRGELYATSSFEEAKKKIDSLIAEEVQNRLDNFYNNTPSQYADLSD